MHAIGWVALRGDDVVFANFEPLAIGGELLGEVGAATRLVNHSRKLRPCAFFAEWAAMTSFSQASKA
jgi:hypothetical protein